MLIQLNKNEVDLIKNSLINNKSVDATNLLKKLNQQFACLESKKPEVCEFLTGDIENCIYAMELKAKGLTEVNCQYYKQID
jgi:hypothetical protein